MAKLHPYAPTLIGELGRHGLNRYRFEVRGKHMGFYFLLPDGRTERFTIIPITPSDGGRGALNAKSDLRKVLAKHGAVAQRKAA